MLRLTVLLQGGAPPAEALPGGYGASLFQAVLALLGICVLAWVLLRFGAKAGLGLGRGRRIQVLERTPLDGRHSVALVKVDGRVFLLGLGGGSPTLIQELDGEVPAPASPDGEAATKTAGPSFSKVLFGSGPAADPGVEEK